MSKENVQAVLNTNKSDLNSLLSKLGSDSFTSAELQDIAKNIYGITLKGDKQAIFEGLLNQSYQVNYAQSLVDTYNKNRIKSF
ncbi:MAG: hypothetical protein A4E53_04077 [Pelotomaculum sp. PtaB.Bin104]|nr:MAG: hypothetical protein A4E53_04077 [Pelotomaculum sp. PtaB.Bin104]